MNRFGNTMIDDIVQYLGSDAKSLLEHTVTTIPRDTLYLPGPDFVDRVWLESDRPLPVIRNLQSLYGGGRLAGTGYLSILPVDQGVEHSAGASFAANPEYFDPAQIVRLALEGGCNAVASTFGVLGAVARRYAHRIPFIVKLNHNELLTYPNRFDQVMFGTVREARDMGAAAVGATIYFGSPESTRQIVEVSTAFAMAHEFGLATVLWCYLRNPAFKSGGVDYHLSADLTGQANHLGVTIKADIIKQKLPENNGGYRALSMPESAYGKTDSRIYSTLTTDHPIDLVRYQVANCYMGRVSLINSGGASTGTGDLAEAVRTAVINKRAGGAGLISGRKAFQRSFTDGVQLLNAVQDVYRCAEVTVA
jgi:class I fructose-bisphosphate aldolase